MTREAIALVNSAIDQLVLYDSALLGLDVTERSLLYRLAPRCSFDADELSGPPRGLSVVALVSSLGESFGYYVAAEDLTWSWKPRSDCAFAW